MKRAIALILTAILLLSLAACGGPETTTPGITPPPITTVAPTEPPVLVTVTLDPNGGACDVTSLEAMSNACYGPLPAPQLEKYVFLGWFTQREGGEPVTQETRLRSREAHTLYAHWEVQTKFTLTLDPNAGLVDPAQVTVTVNEPYGDLPVPKRDGYDFLGWFTEAEGGTLVESTAVFTEGEDMTLYAHWEYNPFAYWTCILQNRVAQLQESRKVVVYLERITSRKTYIDCPFLTDAGAINPAAGLESEKVTDEWISSQNPWIIIKLTNNMNEAVMEKIGMLRRFPNAEIYIFPKAAITGSEKAQLYYRLQLAKILYPEFFEDVDMTTVKKELELKSRIYY